MLVLGLGFKIKTLVLGLGFVIQVHGLGNWSCRWSLALALNAWYDSVFVTVRKV